MFSSEELKGWLEEAGFVDFKGLPVATAPSALARQRPQTLTGACRRLYSIPAAAQWSWLKTNPCVFALAWHSKHEVRESWTASCAWSLPKNRSNRHPPVLL